LLRLHATDGIASIVLVLLMLFQAGCILWQLRGMLILLLTIYHRKATTLTIRTGMRRVTYPARRCSRCGYRWA
jgi:hypothetical protein